MNDEGYSSMERLHVESETSLGLGFEEKLKAARAEDAKMDGEGKKSSKKPKVQVGARVEVDSDDNEPIGSLFKLKKHRNPKRIKSGNSDGGRVEKGKKARAEKLVVKDDDLGEMEDTLANLRKKLKGPKVGKDVGSGGKGKGLVQNKEDEIPSCSGDGSTLLMDLRLVGVPGKKKSKGSKMGKDGASHTDKGKSSALGVGGLISEEAVDRATCNGDGLGSLLKVGSVGLKNRRGRKSKSMKAGEDLALTVAGERLKQAEESPSYSGDGSGLLFDLGSQNMPKKRRKRSMLATSLKKTENHAQIGDVLDPRSGGGGGDEEVVSTKKKTGKVSVLDVLDSRSGRGADEVVSTKKKNGKVSVLGESSNHSSDENLEFSLSEFIRKSQSGTFKKARSSSVRKKRKVDSVSGDGLSQISDGVLEDATHTLTGGPNSTPDQALVKEIIEAQRSDEQGSQSTCWIDEGTESSPVQELPPLPETAEEVAKSMENGCSMSSEEISQEPVCLSSPLRSHYDPLRDLKENPATSNDNEHARCNKFPGEILCDPISTSPVEGSHSCLLEYMDQKPAAPSHHEFDKQAGIPEKGPGNQDFLHLSYDESENVLSRELRESCFVDVQKLIGEAQSLKNGLKQCSHGEELKIQENGDDEMMNVVCGKVSQNLFSSDVLSSGKDDEKLNGTTGDSFGAQQTITEVGITALDQSCLDAPSVSPLNLVEDPSASYEMPKNEILVPCIDAYQSDINCERNHSDNCLDVAEPSETILQESGEKLSFISCKKEAETMATHEEVPQDIDNSLMHTWQSSSLSDPLKMEEVSKVEGLVCSSEKGLDDSPIVLNKYETAVELDDSYQAVATSVEEPCNAPAPDAVGVTPRSDDGLHPAILLDRSQYQLSSSRPGLLKKDENDIEFDDSCQAIDTTLEKPAINTIPDGVGETPGSDLIDDVTKHPDTHSPINQEESIATDDVSNHLSNEFREVYSAFPQCKPSNEDALKESSNPCSQSINLEPETFVDDEGKAFDLDNKESKTLPAQRAGRIVKKRRHGDMAYEGDSDWDFLMHGQRFFENSLVFDVERPCRTRNKFDFPPNMGVEGDSCGTAAVAAGLKARAAGPFEKIRFKDVLKRRGGLQEYLECRNLILGLWSKDMCRILSLSDCGVTEAASEDEPPRASLIREIYAFLNHNGYINVGVAYEKEKGEPGHGKDQCRFSEVNTTKGSCLAQVADSEDGVASVFGQAKSSVNLREVSEATKNKPSLVTNTGSELSTLVEFEECVVNNEPENGWVDAKPPNSMANLDSLINHCSEVVDGGQDSLIGFEQIRDSSGIQSTVVDPVEGKSDVECNLKVKRRIIVIGAGPAGLTAARHLQRQGFSVTVLEARDRLGGRVYTDRSSLSVPVDLGASIITGVEADVATERRPDPSSLICSQLGLELTVLNSDCPLYDIVSGQKVPAELDEALEAEYNSLLDDMVVLVAQKGERAMRMSLEDGLEYALKKRRLGRLMPEAEEFELDSSVNASFDSEADGLDKKFPNRISSKEVVLSPLERRVMNWHFANLEYGCAALLKEVSLPYWNQDDVYGGFGGAHCMIKGGYSTVIESLGKGLDIYLNHVVSDVSYSMKESGETDELHGKVKVCTSNGSEFSGDAVLVTVPLGCLKANTIRFSPSLPEWKQTSIQQLGFGVLNKVVLQFPEVFWDDSVDYFGATAEQTDSRGQCFMFWNVKKTVGAPVLIALVVGKAAIDGQSMTSSHHVNHALKVLRKLFGEASVPDPVASVVTNWGQDPFSRGAYSYVAVGASGEDYDILGRPVENCLFFAGEATCKEHPDTVGGAMMSGLREAVRIIDILNTGDDHMAEVEAMEAAQRQSESERNEVRDILKRLEAVEFSNGLCKSNLDGDHIFTKAASLQDMFRNAKTTAGRLHLAKKLLNLPVEALKSFAGTKEGLNTLNSWILDSMGKDGTQLLRHCVRLLVLVSTDLLAVRLSGIGRTVKEKVCVHTSRDIRAVASQLVSMWIEVLRKEKATNGGLKLPRQTTPSDSLKAKSSKAPTMGKLSRTSQSAAYNRGNMYVPSSPRNNKKNSSKPVKLESVTDSKAKHQLRSQLVETLDPKSKDNNLVMSEEEAAAFAAAEAARAAALAAAEAYASKEAECSTLRDLPKIPSFHKFARREQYAQMDDSDLRRKWSGVVLGRQDCLSDIDSRNCKVRNWSVDFSAACANLDSSRMSGDNYTQQSYSNEVMYQANLREHSGESVATDNRLTKAWVDSAGSGGVKDYHAIERWQSQAAAADCDYFNSTLHIRDEEDSNTASKQTRQYGKETEGSAASQAAENQEVVENQQRGVDRIKKAVVDYVGSLLMPLYKARKIDKEGYKSIMKKSATKVMEQTTDAEKVMTTSEFLDFKRKNKIRAFVDKLIEKHMAMNPVDKP